MQIWMVDHRSHSELPAQLPAEPGHTVYLARDVHGEVLYVGVTSNLYRRLGQHSQRAPWWSLAHSFSLHGAKSRQAADRIEAQLIATLQPPHNVRGVA